MTKTQRWLAALFWTIKAWSIILAIGSLVVLVGVFVNEYAAMAVVAFLYTVGAHYYLNSPPKGYSK